MTGATIIDPDITDSHGSTISGTDKYVDVQHPMLVLKFETYCLHVEQVLEQLTPEIVN